MALATIRWPGPSGIPASLHVPDPAIPAKPPAPHREHVSYVSAQVRGHLRLPAVGKVDEIHNLNIAPRGDQVAGRFTLIPTSAFTPGQEWAALVAAVEGSLRLYRHKDGALVTLADYLHRRPRGMLGSLLWLLRDASCHAILDGAEKITRKSLDQIAVDMTAQAPPPRTGTAKR